MSLFSSAPGSLPSAGAKTVVSHIGAGATLAGDLSVPGLLELSGHVDGKLSADAIVIEDGGSAVGEIRAASVAIRGHFEGAIFGGDVRLSSSAKVVGEIIYQALTIESGAEVNASCARQKAPKENSDPI